MRNVTSSFEAESNRLRAAIHTAELRLAADRQELASQREMLAVQVAQNELENTRLASERIKVVVSVVIIVSILVPVMTVRGGL